MSKPYTSAGSTSLGACESVVRGPRTPQSAPALPQIPVVQQLVTPAGAPGAGAPSDAMVREVVMIKKPGKVYPGGRGEPAYPIGPAGAASDMQVKFLKRTPEPVRKKR